jgi:hypothetical protein
MNNPDFRELTIVDTLQVMTLIACDESRAERSQRQDKTSKKRLK